MGSVHVRALRTLACLLPPRFEVCGERALLVGDAPLEQHHFLLLRLRLLLHVEVVEHRHRPAHEGRFCTQQHIAVGVDDCVHLRRALLRCINAACLPARCLGLRTGQILFVNFEACHCFVECALRRGEARAMRLGKRRGWRRRLLVLAATAYTPPNAEGFGDVAPTAVCLCAVAHFGFAVLLCGERVGDGRERFRAESGAHLSNLHTRHLMQPQLPKAGGIAQRLERPPGLRLDQSDRDRVCFVAIASSQRPRRLLAAQRHAGVARSFEHLPDEAHVLRGRLHPTDERLKLLLRLGELY
mmetsp:Transcript_32907/g.76856  ORF Transcript_32907/g.76856 Transcript_32907/m.76856 type:complete len:299 (-) Transcript_32907:6477-7373(-)